MPFFSKVFRSKDSSSASKSKKSFEPAPAPQFPPAPQKWEDAWARREVAPAEVQELIHVCTQEMKTRVLDVPFLILPFRPEVDQSAARSFIRNYFRAKYEGNPQYKGQALQQELRLTEPMVLCSVMKWCWSRIPGGVVSWDAYELFRIGEQDSKMARHAFDTFIPLSVESDVRKQIIVDFFDLLAAIAAHSKVNGLGGRKLSRMAGWWAFELSDNGNGFDGGYKSWQSAADASCHLFFAYLRSRSPESMEGINGITSLPRSLQALVSQTEYPPERPVLMQTTTTKVVMIVDSVSPTPFALLRRAKHFEYRDDDRLLQAFSSFEDPVDALTDECQRVLRSISSTNQSSSVSAKPRGVVEPKSDPTWSRFEDLGFSNLMDDSQTSESTSPNHLGNSTRPTGLQGGPRTRTGDYGRPTTPSWADFLSSGFTEGQNRPQAPFLLPPDKQLPQLSDMRGHSSQSHVRHGDPDNLEPGELASIITFDLDDSFWWVWMISLAGEETAQRKAVFGRCALIETMIGGGRWLVMEEQVKGAGPPPEEGAYIVEKKSRNPFSRRNRLARRKSTGKKSSGPTSEPYSRTTAGTPTSKTTIGPDQQAKVHAVAEQLAKEQRDREYEELHQRRARFDDQSSVKTNSVLTLQPMVVNEAGPAMKWAKEFDKDAIRAKYLRNREAGTGRSMENLIATANGSALSPTLSPTYDKPSGPQDLTPRDERSPYLQSPNKDITSASPLPSPAPLPVTPSADAKSKAPDAADAAQVPLPVGDEKPLPIPDDSEMHPALRTRTDPERTVSPEPASADEPASPESMSKRAPTNKLKKDKGGGGFMRLFGKRKPAPTTPKKTEAAPAGDPRRVVPQGTVAHRLSLLQKNGSTETTPTKPKVEQPTDVGRDSPVPEPQSHDEPRPNVSRVHTHEQTEADQAFSRFDQGPLQDQPAFVPDDVSSSSAREGSPGAGFQTRAAERLYDPTSAEPPSPVSPANEPHTREPQHEPPSPPQGPAATENEVRDDESEASIDLTRKTSPTDRWAQIRKNAAERANRVSEEQHSRPSQGQRTDDGETSGEETIESRVARIKARVAELTGNMDADGKIQTGSPQ